MLDARAPIMLRGDNRLFDCVHVEADGEGLFQLACESDLEGGSREMESRGALSAAGAVQSAENSEPELQSNGQGAKSYSSATAPGARSRLAHVRAGVH